MSFRSRTVLLLGTALLLSHVVHAEPTEDAAHSQSQESALTTDLSESLTPRVTNTDSQLAPSVTPTISDSDATQDAALEPHTVTNQTDAAEQLVTTTIRTGWYQDVDKQAWFFFDANGQMKTGWIEPKEQEWYFLDATGKMVTGWQNIGAKRYYFNELGRMVTGWFTDPASGGRFYFSESGALHTGAITDPLTQKVYVFDAAGRPRTGWVLQEDTWYFLDPTQGGAAHTGWHQDATYKGWFHFDTAGKMQVGWVQPDNTDWFYLEKNGKMVTDWQTIGAHLYFFNETGRMATGWKLRGNAWYYLNPDRGGAAHTGWHQDATYSGWFHFDKDGVMQTGWIRPENTDWFYLEENGKMVTGWKKIGTDYFHFNEFGHMTKGWLYDKQYEGWFYFAPTGRMQTGWTQPDGDKRSFFLEDSGKAVLNTWKKKDDYWVYLDENGGTKFGWHYDQKYRKWYYFDDNGRMQTGWLQLNGKWYYLNEGGDMAKGWIRPDGVRYYYLDDTGAMVTGSHTINGSVYRFNEFGAMIEGVVREGNWHSQFNDAGKLIAKWDPNEVVIVNGNPNRDTIYLYNDQLVNQTYVVAGTLMFVNHAAPVKSGYTAVLVSGVTAYAKNGDISTYAGKAPRFVNEGGNVYHYFGTNDSYVYRVGKAPAAMAPNTPYYSFDSVNFAGFTINNPNVFFNLRNGSDVTAEELNRMYQQIRPDSLLAHSGQAFKDAERTHNVNALYLVAHSALESAWGTSEIAKKKNNFFGVGAYDSSPLESAHQYADIARGISEAAKFISNRYLTSGSVVAKGPYLGNKNSGMNVYYASDPYWGRKIADIMSRLDERLARLRGQ